MIEQLTKMSNKYGSDESYVLAGGGNTSCKDEAILHVKGSGTTLATITAEGFVAMDRAKLNAMMSKGYPSDDAAREKAALEDVMNARMAGSENKRPSVETPLHNMIPYRFVLHIHPAMVNGLTCGKDGKKIADALFGEDYIWVPITKPGYVLSKCCAEKIDAYKAKTGKDVQVILLQNHGIFFAADTVEEIDTLVDGVFEKLKSCVKKQPDFALLTADEAAVCAAKRDILAAYGEGALAEFVLNGEAKKLCASKEAFAPLEEPFTPDHIVYCKANFLYVTETKDMKEKVADFMQEKGYEPRVVAVQGLGFFAVARSEKELSNVVMLLKDAVKVAFYTQFFGGYLPMTKELSDFIINWEVEAYRSKVSN